MHVSAALPLTGISIVIDPGHGGADPGAVVDNVYESNINLAISKYLANALAKYGASVTLIRDDDYDLSTPNAKWRKKSDFDNRIKIINNSNAILYLSIHLNYLEDSTYYGPQVFYNTTSNELIATTIQEYLNEQLKTHRETKSIPSSTYMYDLLTIPGVLIECGFLSNETEREKLITDEYQEELANIIADAVVKIYE